MNKIMKPFLLIIIFIFTMFIAASCGDMYDMQGVPVDPAEAGNLPPAPISSPAPSAAPANENKPITEFNVHEPVIKNALQDAVKWAKDEFKRIEDELNESKTEIDTDDYKSDFSAANKLYKAKRYKEAEESYAKILKSCPVHLGARNNYVLALAYQKKYEESLKNSILLGLLHPSYQGNWVNIQIPLYALGYDLKNHYAELKKAGMPDNSKTEKSVEDKKFADYIVSAYAYNFVYSAVETKIDAKDLDSYFNNMKSTLEALKKQDGDDPDYPNLLKYLDGLLKLRKK